MNTCDIPMSWWCETAPASSQGNDINEKTESFLIELMKEQRALNVLSFLL